MNNSNNSTLIGVPILTKIISYFSASFILIGVVFNTLTFLIIISHKNLRKTTSMVYLLYISINYTLSLLEWNLDHFTKPQFGFYLVDLNIVACRLIPFFQYFSLQSNGFLLTISCIDRYITVISTPGSFASRLPFRTPKSAHLWSWGIMGFVFVLNSHVLVLNGIYEVKFSRISNATKTKLVCMVYSTGFRLLTWENVHLVLYNLTPFIIMMIFNFLLIKKIRLGLKSDSKRENIIRNARSILFITLVFLVLTIPASIGYAFFYNDSNQINIILDEMSFFNSSTLFFTCFLTNLKFRKVVVEFFGKKSDSKYRSSSTVNTRTCTIKTSK